jgi:hypothetical protein
VRERGWKGRRERERGRERVGTGSLEHLRPFRLFVVALSVTSLAGGVLEREREEKKKKTERENLRRTPGTSSTSASSPSASPPSASPSLPSTPSASSAPSGMPHHPLSCPHLIAHWLFSSHRSFAQMGLICIVRRVPPPVYTHIMYIHITGGVFMYMPVHIRINV